MAEQIVSNERKREASDASPWRLARARPTRLAISSDSPESIVVWFATPILSRSRAGSKPGDAAREKRARNSSRSPPRRIQSQTTSASARSSTTRYAPPGESPTREHVARVSSWFHFPWTRDVNPSRA